MLAQWTGDVVGELHTNQISAKELAAEIGWHEKYLSAVLNCKRNSPHAEEKCREAISRILVRRLEDGA